MKRYLITTADERTWRFDQPVVFLGEWCRRYDRRPAWSALDAVVAPPFAVEVGQKRREVSCVRDTTEALWPDVVTAMNAFHGTDYGRRYWEILLGHWLLRFVAVVRNRYATLARALDEFEIAGTSVLSPARYTLATTDSDSFIWATNDDLWNHTIWAGMLDSLAPDIAQTRVPIEAPAHYVKPDELAPRATTGPRGTFDRLVRRTLPAFARHSDALIIRTYLPARIRMQLELALGQFPQAWDTPRWTPRAAEPAARAALSLERTGVHGVEREIRAAFPKIIPSCYLEAYGDLQRQAEHLPWPRDPKFIFTSNSFDTDEPFKIWTAARAERGVPYFVGQHGNNFGTHIWEGGDYWPERTTPDRFITWGWSNDARHLPAFVFKTAGRKPRRATTGGGLLLIEVYLPHRFDPQDNYYEYVLYQNDQFEFVENLPADVATQLTVRLHAQNRYHDWFDADRWRDRSPRTHIDDGRTSLRALIDASRIVVHSYDSTGILETLALNIPTVCFWRGGLEHLVPGAKPHYEALRAVGIIHDTAASAAAHVARHWSDVDGWWQSAPVQDARAAFCEQYARTVPHPVRTLKRLLTESTRVT